MLFMSAWTGDLGLDSGAPQNVYTLDKSKLKRIDFEEISPGETWTLPDGVGSVTFVGVDQFATFNISSDPGQNFALAGALLAIVGVIGSLYVQRRRVWVRVVDRDGRVVVEIGAMSRYEDGDVSDVVTEVDSQCRDILNVPKSPSQGTEESHD
jgi:cytochrome c biogenesis protein